VKSVVKLPSVIVGALFTLFGLSGVLESALLARKAERATATVVSAVRVSNYRRSGYNITIDFRTADQQHVQAVLKNTGSDDTAIEPGRPVDILYQSDNPTRVRRDTFLRTWGIYSGLALFGLMVMAIGVLTQGDETKRAPYFSAKSKRRQRQTE
jgi:hypothetical protein